MAKQSIVARNLKRKRLVAKYATKRRRLKKMLLDPSLKPQEKEQIQRAIRRMPRDASRTRVVDALCPDRSKPGLLPKISAFPHCLS